MPSTAEEQELTTLRNIILGEDRHAWMELKRILDERPELASRIDPIIIDHLNSLRDNFPDTYRRVVSQMIDTQLKNSQETLINILYPRLGILIRKYIANEFRLLRELVDQKVARSPFSRFRTNPRASEMHIANLQAGEIVEVYVISRDSGLLLGSASAQETVDKAMIAGMLTAIKAFVEDAFFHQEEELQSIQYGQHEIIIHNFYNYYIALAVSGNLSETERDELTDKILAFAAQHLNRDLREPETAFYAVLHQQLFSTFIAPANVSQNRRA